MTDDFRFIGTEVEHECFVTISANAARMSKGMADALGDPSFVTVEANSEFVVRVSPCQEGHKHAVRVDSSQQFGKLGPFSRRRGLKSGKYSVEIRDGAAYFQMEKLA